MVIHHKRPTSPPTGLTFLGIWWQRRETERQLNACSDRVLADIGIAREDIPLVARRAEPLPQEAGLGRPSWAAGLLARIATLRQSWSEQRRIRRELMSYSEQDLEDLGIKRRDIPAIARGHTSPTPA
jgi:uncharacterized protein YjiS (DUF1127 family)